MTNHSKKTAIVTGASRGIGAAIAKKLASLGFAVVVNYAGNQAKAEEVVNDIKASGGDAVAVQGDVSKSEDVERLFDTAEKQFGGVDVLVNNAGVQTPKAIDIGDTDDNLYDQVFGINTRGTFLTLRQAAKRLL